MSVFQSIPENFVPPEVFYKEELSCKTDRLLAEIALEAYMHDALVGFKIASPEGELTPPSTKLRNTQSTPITASRKPSRSSKAWPTTSTSIMHT